MTRLSRDMRTTLEVGVIIVPPIIILAAILTAVLS